MMPDVDGFAVLEAGPFNALTANVPVIIISGKLLNYQDIQRLNHFKTVFATKGILTDGETTDLVRRLADEPSLLPQPTSLLIKQALSFLHQNYDQPINRKDIAMAVGINPNYLSQIFRQEMSISPLDYLNRFRIQKSQKRPLLQTQETITNRHAGWIRRCRLFQPRISPADQSIRQHVTTTLSDEQIRSGIYAEVEEEAETDADGTDGGDTDGDDADDTDGTDGGDTDGTDGDADGTDAG